MKFKKLSLIGFKSFANKLEIKFGEGITGIVGPNGCGKSNVADAVRWVLGEQSSKLLRGNNMQDVIFNGTKKRKSQSYAEVSLTFDNSNRSLFPSYDFEEVMITRKLFRSGESEYYINGGICRLRDISEMLRDAGFAREGYTIIGQGRVSDLINSKPEDRRAIFEEAAGIAKYKYKKIEAERKNERTRANLDRIKDAMESDAARLGPLTKQAEKARQYFELKEKLKYHEINYYINQYESAADTKNALSAAVDGFENEIRKKQSEYDAASGEYNAAMEKLRHIDEDIESFHNELLNLSVDREKVSGKVQLLKQQLESLNKQNESLISSNAALSDNYNKLTAAADARQIEYSEKCDVLKAAQAEAEQLNKTYDHLEARVADEERKIEAARRELLDAMERKAAVSQSIGELTAERAAIRQHVEDISSRVAILTEHINASTAELDERSGEIQKLEGERELLLDEANTLTEKNVQNTALLRQKTETLGELKRDYSVAESRRNMLSELKASMEGYAVSVRNLLNDAKSDARLDAAILGVVGRLIKVKEGFETAIETALGSAVSNVVTATEEDAKFLINHLKTHKYGRATFLPLSSYKPRAQAAANDWLLSRSGCFGAASDAVECDEKFDVIISGLLGGTVIVDNLDTAIGLARDAKYAFRIVTLDGDMVMPQGSYTGGSKKSDAPSVFSHERDLNEAAAKADALKSEIENLKSERDALAVLLEKDVKRQKELGEDVHEYDLVRASKSAECQKLGDEINGLKSNKAEYESTLNDFTERLAAIELDIDAVEKTQNELGTDARTEENDRSHREYEKTRADRDEMREALSAKNLEIVTLSKDAETLSVEIARLKSEAISTAKSIESNDMAILGNNRAMQECNESIKKLSASNAGGNDERRKELTDKLEDLSRYKADLNTSAVENDKARLSCSDEISVLTEKKHEKELLLTRVDSDMDSMHQRIDEEYGLDYEHCLEFKDGGYDPESGVIEIAKLKRRISNLGPINENAVEESQELVKVYHEKEIQRDDLEKSLADEERIIKEMSAIMLRDFNDCFEKIRANFKNIFSELFNGGTADLELVDSDDPLLCGVEIKAQPPAKNLQSISLLSGGEKTLTAIAILFAILKLRPMPFCLLDEIEAALDDANVARFAAYLKKFSDDTQFIVITHRKPTMEQAHSLYGVTMQEEGVTTIVSVRLSEAVQNAVSVPAEDYD